MKPNNFKCLVVLVTCKCMLITGGPLLAPVFIGNTIVSTVSVTQRA